jgi:hypothetical protein
MPKLKHTIADLIEVPGPLRDYYTKTADGKFALDLESHPDSAKVTEFRDKNIALLKERDDLKARFDGIDPEAVKADRLKLAELAARPDAAKLAADLAAEKAAHASTQLKQIVTTDFLRSGGYTSAVDFIAAKAAKVFAMEDGKVTTKEFSTSNPAEPLSIGEWIFKQTTEAGFAFQPSRGGGAGGSGGSASRFGARSDQKILKNPTAQELGANASDIASGKVKVEYSERTKP